MAPVLQLLLNSRQKAEPSPGTACTILHLHVRRRSRERKQVNKGGALKSSSLQIWGRGSCRASWSPESPVPSVKPESSGIISKQRGKCREIGGKCRNGA